MVIRKQFAFDADSLLPSHEMGLSNELQNLLWSSLMRFWCSFSKR